MDITIHNRQRKIPLDKERIRFWVSAILSMQKVEDAAVGVVFVSDRVIRQYNRQYRGVDKATDVLSFPMMEPDDLHGESVLGDIMISLERAKEEAPLFGRDDTAHLLGLLIHGILHLLGYDHEQSRQEEVRMQRREKLLFAKIYKRRYPL